MATLPNFIVIGSMKCGTTALWRNLDQHPAITMGKNYDDPKKTSTEIRFFNNAGPYHNWRRGVDWYKKCFRGSFGGEKCANYIESPTAIKRIKNLIPDVKLILCIREPGERAYSEYFMHKGKKGGDHAKRFDKKVRKDKGYRNRGKYMYQLQRAVFPHFSPDQLYVVIQERMKNDTVAEMNKLYRWLGQPEYETEVVTTSFKQRDGSVSGYRQWASYDKPQMLAETREWLDEYYKPHNEQLFEFLGEDIPEWRA